jgi:soluble lytic murein transglycosylase-like protein
MAGAQDACFAEASQTYGVPEQTLVAIARVESSLNPDAINRSHYSRTNSIDIGMMQVNSRWIKTRVFRQMGYTMESLRDPCTNIKVGAWILANLFRVHQNYWEAIGAYNAACTSLSAAGCSQARYTYEYKVYQAMRKT